MQSRPEDNSNFSRIKKYASNAVQGTLGVVGLGAGVAYLEPAKFIANSSDAGVWLSNLTTPEVATGVFVMGGIDFAFINAYFSSISVQSFLEYIKKQKSTGAKVGKGGAIMFYVLSQDVAQYITSSVTSTNLPEILIGVVSNTPGALYTGVGMMDSELPFLISTVDNATRNVRYRIHDYFSPLSPEDKLYREKLMHYQTQFDAFKMKLEENFRYIEGHAKELQIDATKQPLDIVMSEQIHGEPRTMPENVVHKVAQVLGLIFSVHLTAPWTINTFQILGRFVPFLPLQILITAYLSSSGFYGNTKISMHGMTSMLDNLFNLLRGKSVESIPFQTRPKTSGAVATAAVSLSALSYTVYDFMAQKVFGNAETWQKALRYTGDGVIDFYHLAGLFHFYSLMLSKLTKDDKEKLLFAAEKEVDRVSKLSLQDFITFVEKNATEKNLQYGIEPFPASLPDIENAIAPANNEIPAIVAPMAAPPALPVTPANKRTWGSWLNVWKSKPVEVTVSPNNEPIQGTVAGLTAH